MYCSKEEIIAARKAKKESKSKSGWFKTRGHDAVLRIEYTPSGKLVQQVRARIQNDPDLASLNILVQEKSGNQLKGLCNFVDMKIPDFCGRIDCFPCITANKPIRGRCWKEGVNYSIKCLA